MSAGRRARGGAIPRRGREGNIGVEARREEGVVVAMLSRCVRAGASLELRGRVGRGISKQRRRARGEAAGANDDFRLASADNHLVECTTTAVPAEIFFLRAPHSRYSCTASAIPLIHAAAAIAPGSATLRKTFSGT